MFKFAAVLALAAAVETPTDQEAEALMAQEDSTEMTGSYRKLYAKYKRWWSLEYNRRKA